MCCSWLASVVLRQSWGHSHLDRWYARVRCSVSRSDAHWMVGVLQCHLAARHPLVCGKAEKVMPTAYRRVREERKEMCWRLCRDGSLTVTVKGCSRSRMTCTLSPPRRVVHAFLQEDFGSYARFLHGGKTPSVEQVSGQQCATLWSKWHRLSNTELFLLRGGQFANKASIFCEDPSTFPTTCVPTCRVHRLRPPIASPSGSCCPRCASCMNGPPALRPSTSDIPTADEPTEGT